MSWVHGQSMLDFLHGRVYVACENACELHRLEHAALESGCYGWKCAEPEEQRVELRDVYILVIENYLRWTLRKPASRMNTGMGIVDFVDLAGDIAIREEPEALDADFLLSALIV